MIKSFLTLTTTPYRRFAILNHLKAMKEVESADIVTGPADIIAVYYVESVADSMSWLKSFFSTEGVLTALVQFSLSTYESDGDKGYILTDSLQNLE